MGKRLRRIFGPQLPAALSTLSGAALHVVLRSGIVHYGKLLQSDDEKLVLEDMRHRPHLIRLRDVGEISLELESPY